MIKKRFIKFRTWLWNFLDINLIEQRLSKHIYAENDQAAKDLQLFVIEIIPYVLAGGVHYGDERFSDHLHAANLISLRDAIRDSSENWENLMGQFVRKDELYESSKERGLLSYEEATELLNQYIKRPEVLEPIITRINALQIKPGG